MIEDRNFIKMCEQAEEIQKAWKPQIGDKVKHRLTAVQFISPYDKNTYDDDFYREEGYTYLPIQEQLQNMLLKRSNIFDGYDNVVSIMYYFQLWLNREFYGYYMHKSYPKGNILNELWFAFVMYELYHKIWTGEKWIKKEVK